MNTLSQSTIRRFSKTLCMLLCIWLVFPHLSQADQYDTPYLWRVDSHQRGKSAYLFGTIHSAQPELNRLPKVVVDSFRQSDAFYGELDMSPTALLVAAQSFISPNNQSLLNTLSQPRQDRINRILSKIHPNLSLASMAHLKLWALTASLPLVEDQVRYGNQMAMDMRLYQQAQQNGKQVGGLETIDEQAGVFESFSEQENLQMLDMTLDYIEKVQQQNIPILEETYQAYRSGNPDTFDELLKNQLALSPPLFDSFMDKLLSERNHRMADRIEKLLKEQPETGFFFAIGAAHYSFDEGVQKLLQQRGYDITRVRPQ